MNTSEREKSDLKALIDYFVQKFNIREQDVKDAIQQTGTSSENLEQYFMEFVQRHELSQKNK